MNFIKDLDAKRRRGLSNGKKDVHDIVGGTEVSSHVSYLKVRFKSMRSLINYTLLLLLKSEVGRYSYIVRLNMGDDGSGYLFSPFCGGTLVSENVVVTAGKLCTKLVFTPSCSHFNLFLTSK